MTWKSASCHNCVQLFISHLASWLHIRRFRKPTPRPPEPHLFVKTKCFATILPFCEPQASFSDFLWLSLPLSSFFLPFSDLTFFFASSNFCFSSSVHIVGSLTSKPPSATTTCYYMLLHATTRCYMLLHSPTCSYMLRHAPTCSDMLRHAPACSCMPLHALKCSDYSYTTPTPTKVTTPTNYYSCSCSEP